MEVILSVHKTVGTFLSVCAGWIIPKQSAQFDQAGCDVQVALRNPRPPNNGGNSRTAGSLLRHRRSEASMGSERGLQIWNEPETRWKCETRCWLSLEESTELVAGDPKVADCPLVADRDEQNTAQGLAEFPGAITTVLSRSQAPMIRLGKPLVFPGREEHLYVWTKRVKNCVSGVSRTCVELWRSQQSRKTLSQHQQLRLACLNSELRRLQ